MRWFYILIISAFFILSLVSPLLADESLELLYTISPGIDSVHITSITPVGDFNADGYPDLLIGMAKFGYNPYEGAWLYYGGPNFDTQPDLIFRGDPQNNNICPGETASLFGHMATGLGDFNGDGHNDLAISEMGLCKNSIHSGRTYVYFGGPQPDTQADLWMDGRDYDECFGTKLIGGDYNGDGLGDLIVYASYAYLHKFYIYLGSAEPDTITDALFDFSSDDILMYDPQGECDINGDGMDDFTCRWYVFSHGFGSLVFLGANPVNNIRVDTLWEREVSFTGDFSGDGIDDFFLADTDSIYLSLGGSPFNFDPDYDVGFSYGYFPFYSWTYNLGAGEKKFLIDVPDSNWFYRLELFNLGVPPDTVPIASFDYGYDHLRRYMTDIGDINADGVDEIAMSDTGLTYVNIYSIVTTGINENSNLPEDSAIISAYPNPFNASTSISYSLAKGGPVNLAIYNLLGQRVATLSYGNQNAGQHNVIWYASGFSSGIYFARLENTNNSQIIKMILLN